MQHSPRLTAWRSKLPSPLRHRIDASATYLDANYDDYFPLGAGSAPDYSGRELDRSPKATLSATYSLGNNGRIEATIRERWSESYVVTAFATPAQFKQPGYNKTDISLTYSAARDRWFLQLYGKNLEDEILITGVDSFSNVTPGDPRTYGLRTGLRF